MGQRRWPSYPSVRAHVNPHNCFRCYRLYSSVPADKFVPKLTVDRNVYLSSMVMKCPFYHYHVPIPARNSLEMLFKENIFSGSFGARMWRNWSSYFFVSVPLVMVLSKSIRKWYLLSIRVYIFVGEFFRTHSRFIIYTLASHFWFFPLIVFFYFFFLCARVSAPLFSFWGT